MKSIYSAIYIMVSIISFVLFPMAFFLILLFFPEHANQHHVYYLKKVVACLILIMIAFWMSVILIKFKYERPPKKINEWLFVIATTTVVISSSVYGVLIAKNYMLIVVDEQPIYDIAVITGVEEYIDPYYTIYESSKVTSLPLDAPGFSGRRTCLSITVESEEKSIPLACYHTDNHGEPTSFFEKFHMEWLSEPQVYARLKENVGKEVTITSLPTSKRIIEISTERATLFHNEAFEAFIEY